MGKPLSSPQNIYYLSHGTSWSNKGSIKLKKCIKPVRANINNCVTEK